MRKRGVVVFGVIGVLVGCEGAVTPEVQRSVRLTPASLPPSSGLASEPTQRMAPHSDALNGDPVPIVLRPSTSPVPSAMPTTARWTVSPQRVMVVAGQPVQFSPPLSQLTWEVDALPRPWRVISAQVTARENLNGVWGDFFVNPLQERLVIGAVLVEANQPASFKLDALDSYVRPAFSDDRRAVLPTEVVVTLSVVTTPPLTPDGRPVDVVIRFEREVPETP